MLDNLKIVFSSNVQFLSKMSKNNETKWVSFFFASLEVVAEFVFYKLLNKSNKLGAVKSRAVYPGGKFFKNNRKNSKKLMITVIFFKWFNKFGPAQWFLLFSSHFVFFSTTVFKAGSGFALRKQLDPDPQKMNADPQPW